MQSLTRAMAICSVTWLAGATQAPPMTAKHQAAAAKTNVSVVAAVRAEAPPIAAKHKVVAAKKNASVAAAARAEAMMPKLGELMANSQQSLSQAEALYDKAVQKGKANFSQLLTTEAQAMAASIRTYTNSLGNASAKLELAVNATRAGAAANAPKSGVSFAEVEDVATLNAKVDSLASEARRLARHRRSAQDRAVQEAVDHLEEAQGQVSRKLGDVSTMSDDAKAIVQAAGPGDEDAAVAPKPADVKGAVSKPAAVQGKPPSLAQLNTNLGAAKAAAKAATSAAEKEFEASLAKASTNLAAGANAIKAALDAAEKEEIDRVKAHKVDQEPPRKHFRHHRHHKHF